MERTVKLTIEQTFGHRLHKENFVITVGQDGAEIRRARDPVVSRDRSVVAYIGSEPTVSTVVLRVEETL